MPIYEYECPNGHRSEAIVLTAVRPEFMPCEQCGERALRVAFSVTNWNINHEGYRKNHSNVSRAIERVKKAEREGRA